MSKTAIYDLFNDVSDFRKYVPGISANLEFDELNSSAISARKQISDIITPELWETIKSEQSTVGKSHLANAYGNLIMSKALIFDIIAKRLSGTADVYKNEQETMRRQYLDNYFSAMDSLLEVLSTNSNYSEAWKQTTYFSLLGELKITTTREFHSYYGIDMSFLFFFRSMSLQREILLDVMGDTFKQASERADLTRKLKMALSQLVIAMALTRFDIIELPATIRSLFDEQKASRSGRDEQNRILALAGELTEKAIGTISAVELALNSDENENIVPDTSFNKPEDKIYLLS